MTLLRFFYILRHFVLCVKVWWDLIILKYFFEIFAQNCFLPLKRSWGASFFKKHSFMILSSSFDYRIYPFSTFFHKLLFLRQIIIFTIFSNLKKIKSNFSIVFFYHLVVHYLGIFLSFNNWVWKFKGNCKGPGTRIHFFETFSKFTISGIFGMLHEE